MRAAAETVQAIFLLRELNLELSGLFIEFSYFFHFAFMAFNQSGQNLALAVLPCFWGQSEAD